MDPKEYYYNQFNRDLQGMIAKSPGVHQAARYAGRVKVDGFIAPIS